MAGTKNVLQTLINLAIVGSIGFVVWEVYQCVQKTGSTDIIAILKCVAGEVGDGVKKAINAITEPVFGWKWGPECFKKTGMLVCPVSDDPVESAAAICNSYWCNTIGTAISPVACATACNTKGPPPSPDEVACRNEQKSDPSFQWTGAYCASTDPLRTLKRYVVDEATMGACTSLPGASFRPNAYGGKGLESVPACCMPDTTGIPGSGSCAYLAPNKSVQYGPFFSPTMHIVDASDRIIATETTRLQQGFNNSLNSFDVNCRSVKFVNSL